MYMSNRIGKSWAAQSMKKKRSLEDIDELTYLLKFGSEAGGSKPASEIASIVKHIMVSSKEWLPETDDLPTHAEVFHKLRDSDVEKLEEDSECSEILEEEVSEISIPDKIRCMKFSDLEFYAEMFVDEIIDISIEVCENLLFAALGEDGEAAPTEIPCICDASEKPIPEPNDNLSLSSGEKKEFSGWPTNKNFTVRGVKKKIMEFMEHWHFVEDWKYNVYYIASSSDVVSDYHLYQGIWSIPTKEYPIAQATASVFFTVEVSRVKPKFCLVDVSLQFEGSSSVYKAGQFEFIEQWLFNIIDSKLNFFKTLRF